MRRTWMPADDARLVALYALDTPSTEIAKALNRTCSAVNRRANILHLQRSAEHNRRARAARLATALADPAVQERRRINAARSWIGADKRRADTAQRARENSTMVHCNRVLRTAPEREQLRVERMRAGLLRLYAERLAWCPAERVTEYRALMRKVGAREAKRIVLDEIAAERRRQMAKLTPFERELHRVNTGQSRVFVLPPRVAPLQEGRRA